MIRWIRAHGKAIGLGLVGLLVVVCGGGGWWLTHPPVEWSRLTLRVEPLAWQGDLSPAEQGEVLRAWAITALEDGEAWVGRLPPDETLALPASWQVLGAVRQDRGPALQVDTVWLALPPQSPEEAGRQLLRGLRRAGWYEPLGARLLRRWASLAAPPAPGFLPPEEALGSPTVSLCRREGARMAQAEVRLFRAPDDALVAMLSLVRHPYARYACAPPGLGLGLFFPLPPLPWVVQVPTLAPPPEMRVLGVDGHDLQPGTMLSSLEVQTQASPQETRQIFDAQLRADHWRLTEERTAGAVSWSAWKRRSLRGHRYQVRLFVVQHAPQRQRVILLFYEQGFLPALSSAEPLGTSRTPLVHGDLDSPSGRTFVEIWLTTQVPEASQVYAWGPERQPQTFAWPPEARALGGVERRYRNPWAGPAGSERQWLAQWPRQQGRPSLEEVWAAVGQHLRAAGWVALPQPSLGGWESLEERRVSQGSGWCLPKEGAQLWSEVYPYAAAQAWLLSFRLSSPSGAPPHCATEGRPIQDPLYQGRHALPSWHQALGQAEVFLQGTSWTPGEGSAGGTLTQWAWVRPRGGDPLPLLQALSQATEAQGWKPVAQGRAAETLWVRWERSAAEEESATHFVLGLWLLPVDEGWYLGEVSLTLQK